MILKISRTKPTPYLYRSKITTKIIPKTVEYIMKKKIQVCCHPSVFSVTKAIHKTVEVPEIRVSTKIVRIIMNIRAISNQNLATKNPRATIVREVINKVNQLITFIFDP